jgi:hypothetical protein
MSIEPDLLDCCSKACHEVYPTWSSSSGPTVSSTNPDINNPHGCSYNNTNNTCNYNPFSDSSSSGHNTSYNNDRILTIDTCYSRKKNKIINDMYKKNNNKDTEIQTLTEQNKNTRNVGLIIGAIIAFVLGFVVFIVAKFHLLSLAKDEISNFVEHNRIVFIIMITSLVFITSVLLYIMLVVKGGDGKRALISGSLELTNSSYSSSSNGILLKPSGIKSENIRYSEGNGLETTYIFWLTIDESNMNIPNHNSLNDWQHIFSVRNSNNQEYPGVYLSKTTNVLLFYFNLDNVLTIEIDNIPFNEPIHVSIVIQDKYIEIYINSKLIVSKQKNGEISKLTKEIMAEFKDMQIGQYNNKQTINGQIKDLYNYNRALTHKDIESHYMSILVVSKGYINYIMSLLLKIIMYPKQLLFGKTDKCKN